MYVCCAVYRSMLTLSSAWAVVSGDDLLFDCGSGFALVAADASKPMRCIQFSVDDPGALSDESVPRQGGFIENGTKIVTGSTVGDVQVYSRQGGHPLFILPHGNTANTIGVC